MRTLFLTAVLASVACLGAAPVAADEARSPELKELSVLYAGCLDTERMQRFREFLAPWVKQVETISLTDLKPKLAAPFDVVIADWRRRYGEQGYEGGAPHNMKFGDDFDKPVVMVGAVAGELVRPWSKINWL